MHPFPPRFATPEPQAAAATNVDAGHENERRCCLCFPEPRRPCRQFEAVLARVAIVHQAGPLGPSPSPALSPFLSSSPRFLSLFSWTENAIAPRSSRVCRRQPLQAPPPQLLPDPVPEASSAPSRPRRAPPPTHTVSKPHRRALQPASPATGTEEAISVSRFQFGSVSVPDCFFSIEFRKRSECEDSFDYVGSYSSWIRSFSKRDLRQNDHFPGYHYYHCHARCLVSIACLATYHLYVKPPKLP